MTSLPTRIVVTGGGTGGHVEPVVAVIQALRLIESDVNVSWLGEASSFESKAAESLKVPFTVIKSGKLRRYVSLQNLVDPVKVGVGYVQALAALRRIQPDVVFSKAGYVSVPTLLAAATLRIPIVAHESDSVIGLSNTLAAKRAKVLCTGFPIDLYPKELHPKLHFTGNPVHLTKKQTMTMKKASELLHLTSSLPTLVVLGGSQGALAINKLIWQIAPELTKSMQIVHQVGISSLEEAKSVKLSESYHFAASFDAEHLSAALSLATIAVCRAGANTIADLSAHGVPTIFIPLPTASANHQKVNANYVEKKRAAIVLDQATLTHEKLQEVIEALVSDSKKRETMSAAMRLINPPDAAEKIAEIVLAAKKSTLGS